MMPLIYRVLNLASVCARCVFYPLNVRFLLDCVSINPYLLACAGNLTAECQEMSEHPWSMWPVAVVPLTKEIKTC